MKHLTIVFLLLSSPVIGQEQLTLQQCVDLALANSLQTNNENAEIQTAHVNRKYHFWSFIPDLNGSVGVNTSFGRRIDPFTNTFTTRSVNSQTFGLNSSVTLFDGFRFRYNMLVLDYSIQQKELSLEIRQNELLLRVIDLYTEQCKASAQISQSVLRIEKYRELQRIQQTLIKEGKITVIDTLKSHHSLLNEELLLAKLKSDQRLKNIELNFLMHAPLKKEYSFAPASVSALTTVPKLPEKLEIEQLTLQAKVNENQWQADRASILPKLALNGSFGTGFSSNRKDFSIPGNPTIPWNNQIPQNLSENVGIYLNVPLFNHGNWLKTKELYEIKQKQTVQSIERNQLEMEMTQIENEQSRLFKKAEILQTEQITASFRAIYDKTVLLYSEGRISYSEVEIVFMEWQKKLTELETLKLDYEKLVLLAK